MNVSEVEFKEFQQQVHKRFEGLEYRINELERELKQKDEPEKKFDWRSAFSSNDSKDEIKKLKKDIEALTHENKMGAEHIVRLKRELNTLEHDKHDLQDKNQKLESELNIEKRENKRCQELKERHLEQIKRDTDEIHALKKQNQELCQEKISLQEQCKKYQGGVSGVYEFYCQMSSDFRQRFGFINDRSDILFAFSSMNKDILKHLYEFIKTDAKIAYKEGREVNKDLLQLFEYLYEWHAQYYTITRLSTSINEACNEKEQIDIGQGSSFGTIKKVLFVGFKLSDTIYRSLVII